MDSANEASPTPIHEHALANLRYIREAMERASAFTSIPGWGGLWVGLTAVAAAAISQPFAGTRRWLVIWLIEAAVAALIGGGAMVRKARKANVSFTAAPARRFFVSYFASLAAGAVLTVAVWLSGSLQPLPAVWLVLYGTSFISSGAYSIRVVPVMGVCFFLLGAIAVFLPPPAANVLLGVGFGGLHVIFGFIIARSYGG